jgi:hypothetical protein
MTKKRIFKKKYTKSTTKGKREIGIFRSMSEKYAANQLQALDIKYKYERTKFEYYVASRLKLDCPNCGPVSGGRIRKWYLPDFELPNGLFIEVKGRLTPRDKRKMEAVRKQHPDLNIAILFDNDRMLEGPNKGKMRYGEWANSVGIPWAIKEIPNEWLTGPTRFKEGVKVGPKYKLCYAAIT